VREIHTKKKAGVRGAAPTKRQRSTPLATRKPSDLETNLRSPTDGLVAPQGVFEHYADAPFPIVGIGASAGGLETFSDLLSHLPPDTGMGFVYVQHLDPKHESMLTTLLAKTTTLPIHEAVDGLMVEANHVYVIPPNANLGLQNGKLTLGPRTDGHEPHMSIDHFMRSLAEDRRDRAIGVVLSGSASDGALGLQAIKEQGGLTFAQTPSSAKFDSMPRSAINAGAVDLVLPPQDIAAELARIGQHPYLALASSDDSALVGENTRLNEILSILHRRRGVDFAHYKPTTIRRRIARRMLLNKIDNVANYVRYLKKTTAEVEALYQDVLINVTGLFRDPEVWETLKTSVFPKLLKERRDEVPFRAWVPGCASGEEAYSLAIVLLEYLGDSAASVPIQIFATDISDDVLEKARSGIYTKAAVADVSPERLRRFFLKVEGGFRVKKMIRDMCLFAHHDLSKDPPFSRLDLVSCRNVLIYLNSTLQRKIIPTFHYALNPEGVLVLGHSETIGTYADLFSLLDKKNKLYLKKYTQLARDRPLVDFSVPPPTFNHSTIPARHPGNENEVPDIRKEADRVALAKYAPASVLVNESLDILQFRGRTGEYLEPLPGDASLNLLKMAHEGLMFELRRIAHQAKKQNVPVRSDGIRLKAHGQRRTVTMEVIPLKLAHSKERYFLVTFESTAHRGAVARQQVSRSLRRAAEAQRIVELEQELSATRDYLQSTVETQEATNEELRSAMEEIQSSNEELQSVNEELETAKEELQSTNEELTTVNEELQIRNTELNLVNNDLQNLLTSVHIPVIILDEHLRIRRFTPMAEKVLNLIATDVGRPLGDLRLSFIIPDLQSSINEVMTTLVAKEFEVQDHDGRWYLIRIRPYRTLDNKIDGIVVAMLDIDDLKHGMLEARDARDYAEAIIATVREPLLVLDEDLRVVTANGAYYRTFQGSASETEGRPVFELDNGQWNIPQLRRLLGEVLPQNKRFDDFEMHAAFRTGQKTLLLNAARIERKTAKALILLALEDITEHRPHS
jgi:two-component system CheB/CheR fusion protein